MSRSCKYVGDALAPNVGRISQAHINDTRDIHHRMRRNQAKSRLVSFDVKSLFTNILIAETIDIIRDDSVGPHPLFDLPISPLVFCDLLYVLTSYNQFTFEGPYYRQTRGVPMGSRQSPAMSNIFM